MKKFTFFALAALLLPIGNANATTWTLQGNEYTVDTLQHVKIGPATTYTSLQLTPDTVVACPLTVRVPVIFVLAPMTGWRPAVNPNEAQ